MPACGGSWSCPRPRRIPPTRAPAVRAAAGRRLLPPRCVAAGRSPRQPRCPRRGARARVAAPAVRCARPGRHPRRGHWRAGRRSRWRRRRGSRPVPARPARAPRTPIRMRLAAAGAGVDDRRGGLQQFPPGRGLFAAAQVGQRQHVGPCLVHQDGVEARQAAASEQARSRRWRVGGRSPASRGLAQPRPAGVRPSRSGTTPAARCRGSGRPRRRSRRRLGVLLHGGDRPLQQAQPLQVDVVLGQPTGAAERHRIQQHPPRMSGIHEEAMVAQGELQQRQAQAFDQGLAVAALAQLRTALGPGTTPAVRRYRCPGRTGQRHGHASAAPGPAGSAGSRRCCRPWSCSRMRCKPQFVAAQRLAHALVLAARAQLGQRHRARLSRFCSAAKPEPSPPPPWQPCPRVPPAGRAGNRRA